MGAPTNLAPMTGPPVEPAAARSTKRVTIAGVIAVVALLVITAAAVMTRPDAGAGSDAGSTIPRPQVQAPSAEPVSGQPPFPPARGAGQTADLMLAARTKGEAAAPIAIYEVADFQCPACRTFWAQTLPAIEREYVRTGKAKIIFLNFPIPSLHRNATAAHLLAMCAASQGRFWPMHDLLFGKQTEWAELADPAPYFRTLADSAGLARPVLQQCQADVRFPALVDAETQTSWVSGVKSTPSFIVNGALLAGAAPIEIWRPILDSIFTAATAAR